MKKRNAIHNGKTYLLELLDATGDTGGEFSGNPAHLHEDSQSANPYDKFSPKVSNFLRLHSLSLRTLSTALSNRR
jgi:hypothetical protein